METVSFENKRTIYENFNEFLNENQANGEGEVQ
jgi:hypothetical protein